jgi:uncharacterized OB-fold protein
VSATEYPAPAQDADSAPYWQSVHDRALQVPYCLGCQQAFFYPRTVCPRCGSRQTEWRRASGYGVIYSYTVVRRAPSPAFASAVPYVVALADLDEGCRITARVSVEDAQQLVIGARVVIDYEDVTDSLTLPVLRLADRERPSGE